MKPTDKRFWIAWFVLFFLMVGSIFSERWLEDTGLLGMVYVLSLLSTWLCHKARQRVAFINLIVMIAYNAILSYNLVFNNKYGSGMTWWFFALLLNTDHSIVLIIYYIFVRFKIKTGK